MEEISIRKYIIILLVLLLVPISFGYKEVNLSDSSSNHFVLDFKVVADIGLILGYNVSGDYIYSEQSGGNFPLFSELNNNSKPVQGVASLIYEGEFSSIYLVNGSSETSWIANISSGNVDNAQSPSGQGACGNDNICYHPTSGILWNSTNKPERTAYLFTSWRSTNSKAIYMTYYNHSNQLWTTLSNITLSDTKTSRRYPAAVNFKNESLFVFYTVNATEIRVVNTTDGGTWGDSLSIAGITPANSRTNVYAFQNETNDTFIVWRELNETNNKYIANVSVLKQGIEYLDFVPISSDNYNVSASDKSIDAIVNDDGIMEVYVSMQNDTNQAIWVFTQNGDSWSGNELQKFTKTVTNPALLVERNSTHRIIVYDKTESNGNDILYMEYPFANPVFDSDEFINVSYANNNTPVVVNLSVSHASNVLVEISGINNTMTHLDNDRYEYRFIANSSSDQNITIRFWANNIFNTTYVLNSRTSWLVVDNTQPEIQFIKHNTDEIQKPLHLNVSLNLTDYYGNYTNLTVVYPNGTMHSSYQSNNVTANILILSSDVVGNYTLNFTVIDLAGNVNTTRNRFESWVGVGNINITLANLLGQKNYSTEPTAWGFPGSLDESGALHLNTTLAVTLIVDGLCGNNCTVPVEVNWSSIWNNWTRIVVFNSTNDVYTHSIDGDYINFSSENMIGSWGSTKTNVIEVSSQNGIRYTRSTVSGNYRYLFESNLSKSYNMYVALNVPTTFTTDLFHPRYFVCTGTITLPNSCSQFSTSVDVTNLNNGTNSAGSYDVNLGLLQSGTTSSVYTLQTTQSNFLIEIQTISGAFDPSESPGTSSSSSGGGGGGSTFIPLQDLIKKVIGEDIPECPENYVYNLTGTNECEFVTPQAEEFAVEFLEPVLGPLSYLHIVLIIFGIVVVLQLRKTKKITRRGFLSKLR